MMKLRWIYLFIFLSIVIKTQPSSAQNKQKADSVTALLKTYINSHDTPALYALTSKKYQAAINAKDFADFFTAQIFTSGLITAMSFIGFDKNTARYKLTFEKELLQLSVILDEQSKLDYVVFEPFVPGKANLVATSNPLKTLLEKRIDSAIRVYIHQPNTVGLSVGIINKGQISTYGYGETAKGKAQLPDANTVFEIGSITKTFTATLLAHYVLAGKLKLTDPITTYLPDSVAANKSLQKITLVQLSNHTSGLPSLPANFFMHADLDMLNPYKNYDKRQLFAYLKNCTLLTTPGEVSAYSNMGVGLLGLILEKVSGKSFEQMVNDVICKPLGMQSTAQMLSPALSQKFVSVYNQGGAATPAWDFGALKACGSLHSTITDLLQYAKANMQTSGTLAKEFALTHQVTFNKKEQIGLGWFIIKVGNADHYFHNGGTYGSSSFLAFNAEKNVGVVILSNSALSTDALGVSLLKLIE
jgi:CubicO group peptidase (beta-lactamase class C family)